MTVAISGDRRLLDRRRRSSGDASSSASRSTSSTRSSFARLDPGRRALDRPRSASCSPRPSCSTARRRASRRRSSTRSGLITGMLIPLSLLPGLGRPDRLGARADLGHARRCATRRSAATSLGAARCSASRSSVGVHRALDAAPASLRTPRARARDSFADMRTWLRIFFVGGAISFRALFSWIRPSDLHPDAADRADDADPLLRLPRAHGAPRVRLVVRRRERRAVGVARRALRDGLRDRRRALDADALGRARDAREPRGALPRSRAARARQRGA